MKRFFSWIKGLKRQEKLSFIFYFIYVAVSIAGAIIAFINGSAEFLLSVILAVLCVYIIQAFLERFGILYNIYDILDPGSNAEKVQISTLKTRKSKSTLEDKFSDTHEVCVLSATNNLFAKNDNWEMVIHALKNGCNFKVISFNPYNKHAESFADKIHAHNPMSAMKDRYETLIENIKKLDDGIKKKFQFMTCERTLPYSLFIIKKKNDRKSYIDLRIYSIDSDSNDTTVLTFYKKDKPYYEFYMHQFDHIWKLSAAEIENKKVPEINLEKIKNSL